MLPDSSSLDYFNSTRLESLGGPTQPVSTHFLGPVAQLDPF